MSDRVYGRKPVWELLQNPSRRVERLLISENAGGDVIERIETRAYERGVAVERVPADHLNQTVGSGNHQGVIAICASSGLVSLDELIEDLPERGPYRLVVLDRVQDPVNVGKIARAALYFGAHGLIKTRHESAPISETVVKTSAGATTRLPIAEVTNLRRTLDTLKDQRFWIIGTDPSARTMPDELPRDRNLALVLGNEETGLRRLTRESCDYLVHIPGSGSFDSLNVATAGAVLLYALQPETFQDAEQESR